MNKAILWDMGYTIMANMDQMCDTREEGVWAYPQGCGYLGTCSFTQK